MLDKTAIITSIMVSILQIKYRDNENIDLLKYWYPNTEIKAICGI